MRGSYCEVVQVLGVWESVWESDNVLLALHEEPMWSAAHVH